MSKTTITNNLAKNVTLIPFKNLNTLVINDYGTQHYLSLDVKDNKDIN